MHRFKTLSDGGAVLNKTLVTPYLRLWLVGVELFGSVKNG